MDVSQYRTKFPPREHEEAVRMLLEGLEKQAPKTIGSLKRRSKTRRDTETVANKNVENREAIQRRAAPNRTRQPPAGATNCSSRASSELDDRRSTSSLSLGSLEAVDAQESSESSQDLLARKHQLPESPVRMRSRGTSTTTASTSTSTTSGDSISQAGSLAVGDIRRQHLQQVAAMNGENGTAETAIPSRTIAVQCDLKSSSVKRDGFLVSDSMATDDLASMQVSSISSTRFGFYKLSPKTMRKRRQMARSISSKNIAGESFTADHDLLAANNNHAARATSSSMSELSASHFPVEKTNLTTTTNTLETNGHARLRRQMGASDNDGDGGSSGGSCADSSGARPHRLLSGAKSGKHLASDVELTRRVGQSTARLNSLPRRPKTALSYVSTARLRRDHSMSSSGSSGEGAEYELASGMRSNRLAAARKRAASQQALASGVVVRTSCDTCSSDSELEHAPNGHVDERLRVAHNEELVVDSKAPTGKTRRGSLGELENGPSLRHPTTSKLPELLRPAAGTMSRSSTGGGALSSNKLSRPLVASKQSVATRQSVRPSNRLISATGEAVNRSGTHTKIVGKRALSSDRQAGGRSYSSMSLSHRPLMDRSCSINGIGSSGSNTTNRRLSQMNNHKHDIATGGLDELAINSVYRTHRNHGQPQAAPSESDFGHVRRLPSSDNLPATSSAAILRSTSMRRPPTHSAGLLSQRRFGTSSGCGESIRRPQASKQQLQQSNLRRPIYTTPIVRGQESSEQSRQAAPFSENGGESPLMTRTWANPSAIAASTRHQQRLYNSNADERQQKERGREEEDEEEQRDSRGRGNLRPRSMRQMDELNADQRQPHFAYTDDNEDGTQMPGSPVVSSHSRHKGRVTEEFEASRGSFPYAQQRDAHFEDIYRAQQQEELVYRSETSEATGSSSASSSLGNNEHLFAQSAANGLNHNQLDYDSQHRLNESGLPETNHLLGDDSRQMAHLNGESSAGSSSHLGLSQQLGDGLSRGAGGRYATMGNRSGQTPSIAGRAMSQQSLSRPTMPLGIGRRSRRAGGSGGHSAACSDVGGSSVSLAGRFNGATRYENAHTRTPVVMYIPPASKPGSLADLSRSTVGNHQTLSRRSSRARATSRSSVYSGSETTSRLRRQSASRNGSDSESSSMLRTLMRQRPSTSGSRHGLQAHRRSSRLARKRSTATDHQLEDEDGVGQLATEMDSYKFRRRYSVPKDAKINWFAKLKQRVTAVSKN